MRNEAKSAGGRKNPTFGLRDPHNYVIMYFLLRMGSGSNVSSPFVQVPNPDLHIPV